MNASEFAADSSKFSEAVAAYTAANAAFQEAATAYWSANQNYYSSIAKATSTLSQAIALDVSTLNPGAVSQARRDFANTMLSINATHNDAVAAYNQAVNVHDAAISAYNQEVDQFKQAQKDWMSSQGGATGNLEPITSPIHLSHPIPPHQSSSTTHEEHEGQQSPPNIYGHKTNVP